MPQRPKHPCNKPGCGALTDRRFCAEHERAYNASRPNAARRGYSGDWLRVRAAVLTRDPVCKVCERAPSTDADHYPRSRRELVALGLDPNAVEYSRGVCHACHSRHTVTTDGGFGKPRSRQRA